MHQSVPFKFKAAAVIRSPNQLKMYNIYSLIETEYKTYIDVPYRFQKNSNSPSSPPPKKNYDA